MKDKLIELLETDVECNKDGHGECNHCEYYYADDKCQRYLSNIIADMMLSKGVVVLPVKPNDIVYTVIKDEIKEWKVYFVGINSIGEFKIHIVSPTFDDVDELWGHHIGEILFLTEEDAINELKERRAYEET
jgi:hypothetical protein